jgi:ABC-type transport system substrate-binding protein
MKLISISRTRARVAAVFVATFALVAAATSGVVGSAPAAADDKVVFTVGILNDVDSFNPFLGIEAESYEMWALMYDYMISYNMKTMAPEPGLATSWDTSADGLTWTFHIRTGVKWSDGKPLTAADIASTYNRVLDGGPEAASWGSYLKSVKTITAPDAKTVVMKLDEPNAVLPLLPIPIVPEHIWKDVSEDDVKTYANEDDVVGSGPFRLVSGQAGGPLYKFEANPDYWGGTPNIDEIIFRVFNTEDTAVQALEKGEIDFVDGISPLLVKSLQGKDGITALLGNSPGFDEIAFNVGSVDPRRANRSETRIPCSRTRSSGMPCSSRSTGMRSSSGSIRAVVCRPPPSSRLPTAPGIGNHHPRTLRNSTRTKPPRCSTPPATRWVRTESARCPMDHPSARSACTRGESRRRR